MSKCSHIDSLVTPYVDGALPAPDREAVERHVGACPPCRARLAAERAVRGALSATRSSICSERAPAALRARCAQLGQAGQVGRVGQEGQAGSWRSRLAPLALAASLVLVVGAAFLYQLTAGSTRVMAAELAADHVKCFALNRVLGTHQSAEIVESSMASGFDWRMTMPDSERAGLELVGSRPCLYGEGKVAHIMFLHNGTPVSLFMLPRTTRGDELVRVLGHEADVWSAGDRTFVLVARETEAEVARMAAFIQSSVR
jgi:anti-sigma factor RsiW